VIVKVYQSSDRKLIYQTTLTDPAVLSIAGNVTAGWGTRRSYHVEIWRTGADGSVSIGHVLATVGD
jgi:hypothetical protein